jgi:ribosomal protein S18 acetylase RimI-like enzyme
MTLDEAKEHFKDLPQIMEQLADEAQAAPEVALEEEATEIGRNITDQLKAAGVKEKDARLYAKVYERGFRAMAERGDITPQELFNRYGIKIRGAEELKAGSRAEEGTVEFEQQDVIYDEDSGDYRVETDEVKASGNFMSEDGGLEDFINPEGVFDDEVDISQFDDIERPFVIENIEVNPELRGGGLGRDAMLSMEESAAEAGADAIFLNASPMGISDKAAALPDLISFYESLGYEVIRQSEGNAEMFKRIGKTRELYQSGSQAQASDLGFYSKMEQMVLDKVQGKSASAEQVRALFKDVKEEERKWLGIDDFLKDKKKVSKDELLDFIRANTVQIEEVTLGGEGQVVVVESLPSYEAHIEADMAKNPGISRAGAEERANDSALGNRGGTSFPDLDQQLRDEYREATGDEGRVSRTKFQEHTLPGGENYREVLLTMPPKGADAELLEANQKLVDKAGAELDVADKESQAAEEIAREKFDALMDIYKADFPAMEAEHLKDERSSFRNSVGFAGEGRTSLELNENQQKTVDEILADGFLSDEFKAAFVEAVQAEKQKTHLGMITHRKKTTLRELFTAARETEKDKGFVADHFDQPNILAHVRLNDRTDADGNKVLFVEEIQSDWHQAGRQQILSKA